MVELLKEDPLNPQLPTPACLKILLIIANVQFGLRFNNFFLKHGLNHPEMQRNIFSPLGDPFRPPNLNKPYDEVLGAAQFTERTSISCQKLTKLSKVVKSCQKLPKVVKSCHKLS